jgi:hypothetical protein
LARIFVPPSHYLERSPSPHNAAPPLTFAGWGFLASLPGTNAFLLHAGHGSGTAEFAVFVAPGGFQVFHFDGAAFGGTTVVVPPIGSWVHYAGVFESNSARRAYLNGALVASNTTTVSGAMALDTFSMGQRRNSTVGRAEFWPGHIAEVGVWNEALTVDEIAALAKGVSPNQIRPSLLAAYWPILGNRSPEPDVWRGRDATVVGTAKSDHIRVYNAWQSSTPIDVAQPATADFEVLVQAGGGGGGSGTSAYYGGGGGAGGYRPSTIKLTAGTFTVDVGLGGGYTDGIGIPGAKGRESSVSIIESAGGGRGSASTTPGGPGGSGGGGSYGDGANHPGGAGNTPATTPPQGYAGHAGSGGGQRGPGGGSSGAATASAPGPGTVNSISGTAITYGVGGYLSVPTTAGGGGPGGRRDADGGPIGGQGADGIVILRYLTASGIVATGGTKTTSGAYTVHTFTTSGYFIVSSVAVPAATFQATASIRLSTSVDTLVPSAVLHGAATLAISSAAAMTTGALTFAGVSTLAIATTAATVASPAFAAAAGIAFSVTSGFNEPLRSVSSMRVAASAALLAPVRFAAAASILFSISTAFTASFAAAAEIPWSTRASLKPAPRETRAIFELGGVDVTARVRKAGVTIHDVLNDAPNTASLTFEGTAVPQVGLPLIVRLDDGQTTLFAGALQTVERSYDSKPSPALRHWPCTAIDDTAAANRRRPFGSWVNVSASTIATAIAATYAPTFSTRIEPNLPAVTISFDGSDTMIAALVRLANLIGGYAKIEQQTLHLFIDDPEDAPDPVDLTHPPLNDPPVQMTVDSSQLRTRVLGKGYGERIPADVNAGESLVPITDGAQFTALGGKAIAGTTPDSATSQHITYAGVETPVGGTLVGPGAAPANAPTLGLATGGVVTNGVHQVGVVHVTATGQSLIGPLGSIDVNPLAPPASAPVAAAAVSGTGPDQGAHDYQVTHLMLGGETTPGPISNAVTTSAAAGQVTAPGAPSVGAPVDGDGVTVGLHDYVQTFITAQGETTPSSPSSPVDNSPIVGGVSAPSQPSVGTPQIGAGVDAGSHAYGVTLVTADGETTLSSSSANVSTIENAGEVARPINCVAGLTSPLLAGNLNDFVDAYWYRVTFVTPTGETEGGEFSGSSVDPPTFPTLDVPGGSPSTGGSLTLGRYTYWMTAVTASGYETALGGPGSVTLNIAGQNAASFSTLPLSPDARTVKRNLYRTKVDPINMETHYGYLVATLNDNTVRNYKDTTADSALNASTIYYAPGWGSPSGPRGTPPGWQARVFNIPIGPSGVTARKLYRSTTFNGTYRLITTIGDNSQTQFIDNIAPASEGAPVPTVNTTGQPAHVIPVSNIATGAGGSGVIARRLYRNSAGAGFRFVDELANNTATTYSDTKPNASLGAAPPSSNTTGHPAQDLPVTLDIGPAGVTKRRLFRRFNFATPFKLVATINDNSTSSYLDTKANGSLGEDAPTSNTTGTAVQRVPLSAIPLGPPGTTGRNLYRRFNGSGAFRLVTTLANNTATTFTDSVVNASLGATAPVTNTAVGNQIALSNIPTGGGAVTARQIYLSLAGGTTMRLALTIANNVDRTATLNIADAALAGQPTPPSTDTSGLSQPQGQVNPGEPSLIVASPAPFLDSGGWVITGGGQVLRYTGISGQLLTGIPATGPGAIVTTILYGQQATPAPMLIGVTGLALPMARGASVHVWVQRDDLAAQGEQAARDGSDGIIEFLITDDSRAEAALIARCDADLTLFARPIITVVYATRDVKTKSGKRVRIALPALAIDQTLTIQDVTIGEIDVARGLPPRFTVTASSVRFSLEDTLRRLVSA